MNTTALQSLSTGINAIYQSLGLSPNETDKKELTQSILGSAQEALVISKRAKEVGNLYNEINATGDEDAAEGFREIIQSQVSDLNSTGINNFVNMGKEAVAEDQTDSFTGLLSSAHDLNEAGNTRLSTSLVNEAGNTFSDQGLDLAMEFAGTAQHILDAEYEETTSKSSTLEQFITTWKGIRSQEKGDEEIADDLAAVAATTKTLGASGFEDYFSDINENLSNGSDISAFV
ncbi:MAG: hypothetical protein U9P49_09375 [Thermodesulfobacteriota bacterium]|nr:hypothetical protein [Thermodesulfobacteriota bacterium]